MVVAQVQSNEAGKAVERPSFAAGFPPPLIILGAPRSYTSLVSTMIGQHPECYGMPELNLFLAETVGELVESLSGYKQIQLHGLLRAVAQLYAGEQTMAALDLARRWLIPRMQARTGEVYHELCRRVSPLLIVDKSPAYALEPRYLARIDAAFPDAMYLHLLRHPRGQGESLMRVGKGVMAVLANAIDYDTEPPTIDPQLSWYRLQSNIVTFLEGVPAQRQCRMRGEDILNDPLTHFEHLCQWLGITEARPALAAMFHPEDSPYSSVGPLGAHLGNDINFLQSPRYRAGGVTIPSLNGALSWRADGKGFRPEVIELAQALGYS